MASPVARVQPQRWPTAQDPISGRPASAEFSGRSVQASQQGTLVQPQPHTGAAANGDCSRAAALPAPQVQLTGLAGEQRALTAQLQPAHASGGASLPSAQQPPAAALDAEQTSSGGSVGAELGSLLAAPLGDRWGERVGSSSPQQAQVRRCHGLRHTGAVPLPCMTGCGARGQGNRRQLSQHAGPSLLLTAGGARRCRTAALMPPPCTVPPRQRPARQSEACVAHPGAVCIHARCSACHRQLCSDVPRTASASAGPSHLRGCVCPQLGQLCRGSTDLCTLSGTAEADPGPVLPQQQHT